MHCSRQDGSGVAASDASSSSGRQEAGGICHTRQANKRNNRNCKPHGCAKSQHILTRVTSQIGHPAKSTHEAAHKSINLAKAAKEEACPLKECSSQIKQDNSKTASSIAIRGKQDQAGYATQSGRISAAIADPRVARSHRNIPAAFPARARTTRSASQRLGHSKPM